MIIGGSVIDTANWRDEVTDIALDGVKVAAIGVGLTAKKMAHAEGLIVTLGLIDLQTHIVEPVASRILAYINASFAGIFAFSPAVMVGESGDVRLLKPN